MLYDNEGFMVIVLCITTCVVPSLGISEVEFAMGNGFVLICFEQ